jgi:hypothetical protein
LVVVDVGVSLLGGDAVRRWVVVEVMGGGIGVHAAASLGGDAAASLLGDKTASSLGDKAASSLGDEAAAWLGADRALLGGDGSAPVL